MLNELKNAGIKLSVATNAPTPFALAMLTHLGVADMFDVIIGADKVSASKPNPQMLYEILNFYTYDASKDEAWMIGDNSKDMLSAKNAEINALFATWGFSPSTDFDKPLATPSDIITAVL